MAASASSRSLRNLAVLSAVAFASPAIKAIAEPVDFVGVNVYRPEAYVLASDAAPGWQAIPLNASHPRMLSSWHVLAPEAVYWAARQVHSLWGVEEVYVSENGCGASDEIGADGEFHDTDRVMFLRNNLLHLRRATAEGVPVRGYFHWSLMDNFEWTDGFGTRLGLVHVDFGT